LWLFPKIKSALNEQIFQDTEDIQKKYDDGTESHTAIRVPKMILTVAALLG
jgi:hypothetical protein